MLRDIESIICLFSILFSIFNERKPQKEWYHYIVRSSWYVLSNAEAEKKTFEEEQISSTII